MNTVQCAVPIHFALVTDSYLIRAIIICMKYILYGIKIQVLIINIVCYTIKTKQRKNEEKQNGQLHRDDPQGVVPWQEGEVLQQHLGIVGHFEMKDITQLYTS